MKNYVEGLIISKPQGILLDIDSTLFATYGKQEGNDYNQHYSNYGYHPLLVFDGLTGDLLKAELRSSNTYTSQGIPNFLYPLLLELQEEYPETNLFLRGDSGLLMFSCTKNWKQTKHHMLFY